MEDLDSEAGDKTPLRLKYIQSAVYFYGFIALGFQLGIVGPTLHLFARNTGVSLEEAGSYFSARGFGKQKMWRLSYYL